MTVLLEAENIISGTNIITQRLLRSIWLRIQYDAMVSLRFCGGFFLFDSIPIIPWSFLSLSLSNI